MYGTVTHIEGPSELGVQLPPLKILSELEEKPSPSKGLGLLFTPRSSRISYSPDLKCETRQIFQMG